jgi:hypothetical protein
MTSNDSKPAGDVEVNEWTEKGPQARDTVKRLRVQVAASWPTPTQRDHKDGSYCPNVPVNGLLGRMVWPTPSVCGNHNRKGSSPASGDGLSTAAKAATWASVSNGSSEQTERRGALNPEFVCWLMGYPTEWVNCAPSATLSTSKRPQHSSSQQSKPREVDMGLRPQNIVQAAEADMKRGIRNAQQAAESKQFAPCYEEYAFHRKHVRKAKSAHDLMVLALMDPAVKTKKANTAMIYGNATLLLAAIRMAS